MTEKIIASGQWDFLELSYWMHQVVSVGSSMEILRFAMEKRKKERKQEEEKKEKLNNIVDHYLLKEEN